MWKIIHLNSGHTLVTEDNIDLTKPVITANVLDHETSIALHAISGKLLENVFYPMTAEQFTGLFGSDYMRVVGNRLRKNGYVKSLVE